jgi:hypothetical protein
MTRKINLKIRIFVKSFITSFNELKFKKFSAHSLVKTLVHIFNFDFHKKNAFRLHSIPKRRNNLKLK